ncbi:hypothetical protein Q1695_008936 [Nippostrongylus brasiliensis]|nr:hypothetical protein Q1695_008936 [Nippostrongylus brasiliensis]
MLHCRIARPSASVRPYSVSHANIRIIFLTEILSEAFLLCCINDFYSKNDTLNDVDLLRDEIWHSYQFLQKLHLL